MPPLPALGSPLECDAKPTAEERGTLLFGASFKSSPNPAAADQGLAVVTTGCDRVVVLYPDRLGAQQTQVQVVQVELAEEAVATPLPTSGSVGGWVDDCTVRADATFACSGGLGYRAGPARGGWLDVLDARGEVLWSRHEASAPEKGRLPRALAAGADGGLLAAYHDAVTPDSVSLEHFAVDRASAWSVAIEAEELGAEMLRARALATTEAGELVTAGDALSSGVWAPWLGKHDASGEPLWTLAMEGKSGVDLLVNDLAVLPSGVSVIASGFETGDKSSVESRAGTGVLSAVSGDGEVLWTLESAPDESVEALLVDPEGNLLTLGTYSFTELLDTCQPEDLTCERRALVLRQFDESGSELWSHAYQLSADESPQLKQPSLVRGTFVAGRLLVLGWNYEDGQPWLGNFAY